MRKKKLQELKEYMEQLKTISYTKIEDEKKDESKFLKIERYSYNLNNGKTVKREKVIKNGKDGSAAIILPITENNEIILAIEPRVFTKKTVDVGLPAGYIEEDEEPIISARRELLEETGYDSSKFIELGSFYQDQGCSGAYNYYYVALDCKKVSDQTLDQGEFIKYILVNYEELEELINMGYITGLNSAYAIEKGKRYIRER